MACNKYDLILCHALIEIVQYSKTTAPITKFLLSKIEDWGYFRTSDVFATIDFQYLNANLRPAEHVTPSVVS